MADYATGIPCFEPPFGNDSFARLISQDTGGGSSPASIRAWTARTLVTGYKQGRPGRLSFNGESHLWNRSCLNNDAIFQYGLAQRVSSEKTTSIDLIMKPTMKKSFWPFAALLTLNLMAVLLLALPFKWCWHYKTTATVLLLAAQAPSRS